MFAIVSASLVEWPHVVAISLCWDGVGWFLLCSFGTLLGVVVREGLFVIQPRSSYDGLVEDSLVLISCWLCGRWAGVLLGGRLLSLYRSHDVRLPGVYSTTELVVRMKFLLETHMLP